MRYIRCARNRFEQNMNMVQYGPNIYYHSFKDIMPGEELLVWYESQYEQYFGIPMFIKLSSFGKKPTNLAINRGKLRYVTKHAQLENIQLLQGMNTSRKRCVVRVDVFKTHTYGNAFCIRNTKIIYMLFNIFSFRCTAEKTI